MTDLPHAPLRRLLAKHGGGLRVSEAAVESVEHAAADFLIRLAREAQTSAEAASRKTLLDRDIDHARAKLQTEIAVASRYSRELAAAVGLHDYALVDEIITELVDHVGRGAPYPVKLANEDLGALRKKRLFPQMTRLAEAFLRSGIEHARIRRQLAQALIEQGEIELALKLLRSMVANEATGADELAEARGLIGRAYKQRYVDSPEPRRKEIRKDLGRAIDAYLSVYQDEREEHLWHGINAVTCLLRAQRDGVGGDSTLARAIALRILRSIRRKRIPDVWDLATATEAFVALGEWQEAFAWVQRYVAQPAADTFELFSTRRQLVQVAQIDAEPRARGILTSLDSEFLRRSGGAFVPHALKIAAEESADEGTDEPTRIPMLVRVRDPSWDSGRIPDLVVTSRLGTIVACSGTQRSVEALVEDPQFVSIEVSRPGGTEETARSLDFTGVTAAHAKFHQRGDGALIAVIDGGVDVLHEAFLDENGKSRIVAIWDQRDPAGPRPAGGNGYGTEHSQEAIADYVRNQQVPRALGQDELSGHGTHVASIAAGRATGEFGGGVAPAAKLVFVVSKIDVDGGDRISAGYSVRHQDALKYIDTVARQLDLPVVVNLSEGQNAGAHDGTSLVEAAFDMFSKGGRESGRVVVKSAGNERESDGHAKVSLRPNSRESLKWKAEKRHRGDTIELWFLPADEFRFRLVNPRGEESKEASRTNADATGRFQSGNNYKIAYTRLHEDNGHSRLEVSIRRGELDSVEEGEWRLDITSGTVSSEGIIHAWVEHTKKRSIKFANHQNEEMTLSIPGTARTVITVGAVELGEPIRVGKFSSYGPTRNGKKKPDLAAPGVGIVAAQSMTARDVTCKSGTSMAAPHVSGAIALLFSKAAKAGLRPPSASQIREALRIATKNYNGHWDRGQGYGVLDVEKFLNEF